MASGKGTSPKDDLDPTEQSFVSHLVELRTRLMRAILCVLAVLLVLMPVANPLYSWLSQPMMEKMAAVGAQMIATQVASPFLAPFKLSCFLAVMISVPYIFYQLWAFVAPGLYRNERQLVLPILTSGTLLFYAGVAFAYYLVLPTVFKFFVGSTPSGVSMMTDVSKYLDFVLKLFMAFGFAFEMPVAIVLMVLTGFVTPAQLAARRDYVLVGVFVAAAILTPPDVLSQLMLAVPAYLLYEVGILASRWLVKGREVPAES